MASGVLASAVVAPRNPRTAHGLNRPSPPLTVEACPSPRPDPSTTGKRAVAKSDGHVVQVDEADLQKHRDGHVFTGSGHPDFAASVQPDGGLDRLLQRIRAAPATAPTSECLSAMTPSRFGRDDGSLDALANEGEGIAAAVHRRAPHRLLPQPLLQAPFLMMVRRQRQREGRSGDLSTGGQRESGLLHCSMGLLAKRLSPALRLSSRRRNTSIASLGGLRGIVTAGVAQTGRPRKRDAAPAVTGNGS